MVATAQGDRLFHLSCPAGSVQPYEPEPLGLLRFLAYTAATLGDALRDVSAHFDLIAPASRLDAIQNNAYMVLRYGPSNGSANCPPPPLALSALLSFARAATGQALVPAHVGLRQPAPPQRSELVRRFSPGQVGFGETADTLTLRRGDPELTLRHSDPRLAELLRASLSRLRNDAAHAGGWGPRLRELLITTLEDQGVTSLTQLAAQLAMSPRTLQRRLQDAGTTWRRELDAARRQRCLELQAHNGLSREAIARRLGYSDSRSLRRAAQRWAQP